ncbi:MAG: nodulation protein NfeD [Candidatus Methylomirabilales bacterium]
MRPRGMSGAVVAASLGLVLAGALVVAAGAGQPRPVVYHLPVAGMIDLGLAKHVERGLAEAAEAGARAVILDVNTHGGRLDAAVLIRDALLGARVETVAFVNPRAISAGALISLAASRLAMAEGATIGAATPVQAGGGEGPTPVGEKTISYVRKEFRATAEQRGRPPRLAEAMVDPDVEVEGIVARGKLLTLTTQEALRYQVADLRAANLEALLRALQLQGAEVRRIEENWAESLVRFLTNPVVGSLLMTVGLVGLLVEIRTPGFGVPGLLGLGSLALFFWGHSLVRLAGWEELLLVAAGLVLLGVELFVIPGFGLAGILGIGALLAGFGMSLVGTGATGDALVAALGHVALSLVVAILAAVALLRALPRLPYGRRLILQSALPAGGGERPDTEGSRRWMGRRGRALSALRPAGIAQLEGERVDVVSEGGFVEAGCPVEVVRVDGNRVVVRPLPGQGEGEA